eukprot:GHUV01031310.1.p1 GENE.GHUV01031310.1~~GHUV01031310.1.p1  ORF type:complete len:143 (+),score=30.93 GHUV01031310.1:183-611(+)
MLVKQTPVVVGAGRVGRTISKMAYPALPVYGRGQSLPRQLQAPIWVCTTNDDLQDVVQQLAPSQHQQLIFIQNGVLLPFLASHELQHSTQVLLYMSGKRCPAHAAAVVVQETVQQQGWFVLLMRSRRHIIHAGILFAYLLPT